MAQGLQQAVASGLQAALQKGLTTERVGPRVSAGLTQGCVLLLQGQVR